MYQRSFFILLPLLRHKRRAIRSANIGMEDSSRTPNRSLDFSTLSSCSSVKKTLFTDRQDRGFINGSMAASSEFMMQAKIEHLEKERIELTMQLHTRDEKDRDRKIRLEQLENRLKSSEEERSTAIQECADNREQVVRLRCEVEELRGELVRVNQEVQNTNRIEAMDVWKKMTTATRALKKVEDDLASVQADVSRLRTENNELVSERSSLQSQLQSLTGALQDIKTENGELKIQNKELIDLREEKLMLLHALDVERQQHTEEIATLR